MVKLQVIDAANLFVKCQQNLALTQIKIAHRCQKIGGGSGFIGLGIFEYGRPHFFILKKCMVQAPYAFLNFNAFALEYNPIPHLVLRKSSKINAASN